MGDAEAPQIAPVTHPIILPHPASSALLDRLHSSPERPLLGILGRFLSFFANLVRRPS